MFDKLRQKLKETLSIFSRKAEKEAVEERIEEVKPEGKKEIKELPKEKNKEAEKEEKVIKEIKPEKEKKAPEKAIEAKKEKRIPEKKKEEVKEEKPAVVEKKKPLLEEREEIIKEPEEEKKEGFFSRIKRSFTTKTISVDKFEELFWDLELILLENSVALEVVDRIKDSLTSRLVGTEISKSNLHKSVIASLKEAISSVIQNPPDLVEMIKSKSEPFVILFFGINGSGKTTTVAKIARFLQKNSISCVMAAADTFRAASIEQIEAHAKNLNIPLVKHAYGSDPAAVAFDAIAYAKKNRIRAVLIDTAGRMYTKENLMKEMEKIVRISQPDLKLFIGESIAGNDVIEQARTFNESIGIDGIILSKADVDDKGGAALSVSHVTGKPIFFLGTGQNYSDLKPFKKEDIIKQLGLN